MVRRGRSAGAAPRRFVNDTRTWCVSGRCSNITLMLPRTGERGSTPCVSGPRRARSPYAPALGLLDIQAGATAHAPGPDVAEIGRGEAETHPEAPKIEHDGVVVRSAAEGGAVG